MIYHTRKLENFLSSKVLLARWNLQYAPQLKNFKDVHQGKGCFIIGNGPSLNKMDLSRLNEYYLFGLNKIHLIFERIKLDLSYHVAVNQFVIEQSIDRFKELECPSFLSYQKTASMIRGASNIYFILTSGRPYMFQTDITQPICEGNTVTYVAMQIAFYMGFKQVFLIGVDHSFKCSGKPNERQFLDKPDPNHFDSNYFTGNSWQLPDLEASELVFRLADFHFKRDNRKIYDATLDGKLNIFEKISFEESLELCKKK